MTWLIYSHPYHNALKQCPFMLPIRLRYRYGTSTKGPVETVVVAVCLNGATLQTQTLV
jgi:hypothetical protein